MHPITFIYKMKRRLRQKGEQFCPKLFFAYGRGPSCSDRFFERFKTLVPFYPMVNLKERLSQEEQRELIRKADAVCDHTFDLLGSGPYRFENGISWHLDFKSGFRWPDNAVHSRCTSRSGVDIKVPWELSRFNHAVTLGLAFQLSNDGKYADEFVRQVEDWIGKNPVGYGVNWACCMDVSIRAVNWLSGFVLLSDALMHKDFSGFRQKLSSSLWKHGRFIRAHLEWLGPKERSGANHFLSDLTGVLTLGVFFGETSAGRKWFRFAKKETERQMLIQVFPDGVHFECSPAYHRLCLEMFMWCDALAGRAGSPFSKAYTDRLGRMHQFIADYLKPSGIAPLIGDNDDGRLLNSGLLNMGDHCYLRTADAGGKFYADRFLLDGTTGVNTAASVRSTAYPDGGFYFLKNERARAVIRAGRLAYAGAHAHNDQLSFELTVDGQDVFVDRGTFLYTSDPDARNRFRATSAHNVMQINGVEQSRIGVKSFGMPDETRTRVMEQSANVLRAVHTGFKSLGRPDAEYGREFELRADRLVVTDTLSCVMAGDVIRWAFHLAPGLNAFVEGTRMVIREGAETVCTLSFSFSAYMDIRNFPHSPSYGVIEDAKRVMVEYAVTEMLPELVFDFTISWER
jgi:hypothetical protein